MQYVARMSETLVPVSICNHGKEDEGENRMKLLRLENDFYRACVLVRQSGVELREIRGFLLKELWRLELERRKLLEADLLQNKDPVKVRGRCVACGGCMGSIWNVNVSAGAISP